LDTLQKYIKYIIETFIPVVIGRPGFDSLAESDKNNLKVSIHRFPA